MVHSGYWNRLTAFQALASNNGMSYTYPQYFTWGIFQLKNPPQYLTLLFYMVKTQDWEKWVSKLSNTLESFGGWARLGNPGPQGRSYRHCPLPISQALSSPNFPCSDAVNAFSALTVLVGWHNEHLDRKQLSDEVLAWLSVCSKVQMTCIRSSWCYCHHHLCISKFQNS